MKSTWVWVVMAIIIIGGGVWWWESNQTPAVNTGASTVVPDSQTSAADQGNPVPTDTGATNAPQDSTSTTAPTSATVTYDGNAFSPASVTLKKGGTVKFTDTSGSMWVASNQHPSHTGSDGTSRSQHCASSYTGAKPFDQCGPGTSYTFTFTKAGSWNYHDHLNAGAQGTVIVQ